MWLCRRRHGRRRGKVGGGQLEYGYEGVRLEEEMAVQVMWGIDVGVALWDVDGGRWKKIGTRDM